MRRSVLLLSCLVVAALLAGCGAKGPLTRPVPAATAPAPAGSAPAPASNAPAAQE